MANGKSRIDRYSRIGQIFLFTLIVCFAGEILLRAVGVIPSIPAAPDAKEAPVPVESFYYQ